MAEWSDVPLGLALLASLGINVPQLVRTYKTQEVESFSRLTIALRIFVNLCWLVFASMVFTPLILASSMLNVVSEGLLLYFTVQFTTAAASSAVGSG